MRDWPLHLRQATSSGHDLRGAYVDYLVIASNIFEQIQSTKQALRERFDMTDLGDLKYFLGMEIDQEVSAGTI